MRMLMFGVCLLGLVAGSARAEPFYLRYDADVFPEEAGWERHSTDPGGVVVRTVKDGVLTIDSTASYYATDWYRRETPALTLDAGELFQLEWRMRTLMTDTWHSQCDTNVAISNAKRAYVQVYVARDFVAAYDDVGTEPAHVYAIEGGEWNTFALESVNMQEYSLYVNGAFAFSGVFNGSLIAGPNLLSFGESVIGMRSLSEWDYVAVTVVPEPEMVMAVVSLLCVLSRTMRGVW